MEDIRVIYDEIDRHIMNDDKPSVFLEELLKQGKLIEKPLNMLSDLVRSEQNKKYHPEGNVWNHTLMVLDEAAKRRDKSEDTRVFMWAALLHDIGKYPTTKLRNGKLTSYNHEKVGRQMAIEFLNTFDENENYIRRVSVLVRWHMEPLFLAKNSPSANTEQMLREVSLEELALLATCDRLGRGEMSHKKAEDEMKGIEMFIAKSRRILERMKK